MLYLVNVLNVIGVENERSFLFIACFIDFLKIHNICSKVLLVQKNKALKHFYIFRIA